MTLDGLDVSKWQAVTPSLVGQSFAFARASYSATADNRYAMHLANFRKARIVAGAYHFGVGAAQSPIAAQVKRFLAVAKDADLLALDLERNGNSPTMTQDEARAFIAAVHVAGRTIGLYHSRSGFPSLGQDWNWVAQWGPTPPTGIRWAFWQWQGSPLDRDKFNGDRAALLALAGKETGMVKGTDTVELFRAYSRADVLHRAIAINEKYRRNQLRKRKPTALYDAKIHGFKAELAAFQETWGADFTDPRHVQFELVNLGANLLYYGERYYPAAVYGDPVVKPGEIRRLFELAASASLTPDFAAAVDAAYFALEG